MKFGKSDETTKTVILAQEKIIDYKGIQKGSEIIRYQS